MGASLPPLADADIERLQHELDRVPPPLEALDVSMLDGYLCGVLLQPQPIAVERWLPPVTDLDGRALPADFDATPLRRLVLRRHAELDAAIAQRQWFDPWVFDLDLDADDDIDNCTEGGGTDDDAGGAEGDGDPAARAVYPWVAGFVTALELFPALLQQGGDATAAAMVLIYRHLDPDDLEDADALLEEIESLEPPASLADAVEELVRATLLLADVTRPLRPGQNKLPKPPPRPRQRPNPRFRS